ncbi:MAG: fibronectin type III domain-containing protein [Planctomycetes bacterium]|nr:fibronectin type III domain-containing protein [Planctomycetota bacterium]
MKELLAALLTAVTATGLLWIPSTQSEIIVSPYLQNPAPTAMTIIWLTRNDTPGNLVVKQPDGFQVHASTSTPVLAKELSYHETEIDKLPGGTDPGPPYLHRIRVKRLQPGTTYHYTLKQGGTTFSRQFRTTPSASSSIRFVVYGDSETEPESTSKKTAWPKPFDGGKRTYVVDQTEGYRQNIKVIKSRKPVIAVCAVRTGCGKSQTSRAVTGILKAMGKRVAAIRHPMPYGDLTKQICQRFAKLSDLDKHDCTIEEREEYEPHISAGNVVFAGVDYGRILKQAEKEADVILWDGGNNDLAFYKPDLYIVVADPHRPGHELRYYPGETNARLADVVVVNKVDTAGAAAIKEVVDNIKSVNPGAKIIKAKSPVSVDDPKAVKGKRVLVVEDGPTLTHGEMTFGAGHVAARKYGAKKIVDPRPYAVGSIKATYKKYDHMTEILPAMGYGQKQMKELERTINAVKCDLVLVGTPIDLARMMKINKPTMRVRYDLGTAAINALRTEIAKVIK